MFVKVYGYPRDLHVLPHAFPTRRPSDLDKLSTQLTAAGKTVGEALWRLPLGREYDKQIDCDVADMKNIGGGRAGGSITAAQFLQRFIQDGTPWAHLDIAGVAWATKEDRQSTRLNSSH